MAQIIIKAKVEIKKTYNMNYALDGITLKIILIEPRKLFRVKLKKSIVRHNWIEDEDRIDFLKRCLDIISEQKKIKEAAEGIIKEYFINRKDYSYEQQKENEVLMIINQTRKQKIEIELKIE